MAVDVQEGALTGKLVVWWAEPPPPPPCGNATTGEIAERKSATASPRLVGVCILKGRCAAEAVIRGYYNRTEVCVRMGRTSQV